MRVNKISFRDNMNLRDRIGGLRGEVIFGTGRHLVDYTDPFGNKAQRTVFDKITYRKHNIIPIGGYQYVFDKLFNIGLDQETTLRVGHLNDEAPQMKIGTPRSYYNIDKYNAETNIGGDPVTPMGGINLPANHFTFGFMVGDGGAKEDNITAIAPDYKRRGLFHAIPFRMSNDGYDIEAGKYYGKSVLSTNEGVTSYYIKKFDNPSPHIVHAWASDNDNELEIVDDSVYSSTSSIPIESYIEINLSISDNDLRGYFTTTGSKARFNELGLVAGWYNPEYDDYDAMMMITQFCRSSVPLEDGDTSEAVYRLYAR